MKTVYQFKTLLGHKNLDLSISCLGSFLEMSVDDIELHIFDDGTITDADAHKLCDALPNAGIVRKAARDRIINERLQAFPRCLWYRNTSPFAQKLFDVMLCDESDLLFIDSDVYFLRKFRLPTFGEFPIFMRDDHNAYSFNPSEFMNMRFPIFPRLNTGFFYFPLRYYDLRFLEMLLADPLVQKGFERMYWMEQTLWAFLAGNVSCNQYFDDDQIKMSRQHLVIDDESIAIHLVSSFRFQYQYVRSLSLPEQDFFKRIRLISNTRLLNKYEFTVDRIKRGIQRRMVSFQQALA